MAQQFEAEKRTKGAADGFRGNQHSEAVKPENQDLPKFKSTSYKVASDWGVGHDTVERAAQISKGLDAAEEVSPGFREAVLTGAVINRIYLAY